MRFIAVKSSLENALINFFLDLLVKVWLDTEFGGSFKTTKNATLDVCCSVASVRISWVARM